MPAALPPDDDYTSLARSPRFIVLDRESDKILYEADSLHQARGYVDASEKLTRLAAVIDSRWDVNDRYRICMVDENGQVVARGPVVSILEAPELLCRLTLVLLPVSDDADWDFDTAEGGAA